MSSRVGVGYSERPDTRAAGAEAARAALSRLDGGRCDLVMLFATAKHDAATLHAAVREVVGPRALICGGSAAGAMTNASLGYAGHQVGVAAWTSDTVSFDLVSVDGLDRDERSAGVTLAERVRDLGSDEVRAMLVFYDSIAAPPPALRLNMATTLVEGMRSVLDTWPSTAGMGFMGDFACSPTAQFLGDRVVSQSAAALVLRGQHLRMDAAIMHGCYPVGDYHTITRAEGAAVVEIDGRPALEQVEKMLGPDAGLTSRDYPFFLTLGVNQGSRFEPFREENYASRLCMGVDDARGALIMFEPDLREGSVVQLMRRRIDFGYLGERTRSLLDGMGSRRPVFAFYIDCMGRAASMTGWEEEEASEVQRAIGDIPFLGVYSGVEIARVGEVVRALDWTGVLCVFSE